MASSAQDDVIVIDRLGDTILTLKSPNAVFAVWEQKMPDIELESDSNEEEVPLGEKILESRPMWLRSRITTLSPGGNDIDSQPDTDDGNGASPSIMYRVSSRHLMSGSAKFRNELTGPWDESSKKKDGMYHLNTSEWDIEAFAIFLNVLHLRNRQVPKALSLEMLAKVAVLVDYYRCWEAFDLFSILWVENVRGKEPVPGAYMRELMLWMVVSWVFRLPYEFMQTTRIAIRQNKEPHIRDMELGIPPAILKTLESERSAAIDKVVTICHGWIEKFDFGYFFCRKNAWGLACNSLFLGGLMKALKGHGLLSPRPKEPFQKWSIESICSAIRTSLSEMDQNPHFRILHHKCRYDSKVIKEIDAVMLEMQGLDLKNFKDQGEEA